MIVIGQVAIVPDPVIGPVSMPRAGITSYKPRLIRLTS
jgi:hypothetical protein